MRLKEREYIRAAAVLKHMPRDRHESESRWPAAEPFARQLIEQSSASQANKWRQYAASETGGTDCAPRSDVA